MTSFPSLRRAAFLLCASAMLTAPAAQAQLPGRLKKLGKDMLKDAKDKVGGKDSATTSDKAGTASAATATTSKSADYAITNDRITLFLGAITPLVKRAELATAAAADKGTFEAKRDKFEACLKANTSPNMMPSAANMEAAGKLSQRLAGPSQRANQALQSNDYRTYVFASDSVRVLTSNMMAVTYGLTAKCGSAPYSPTSILESEVASRASGSDDDAAGQLAVSPDVSKQLTRTQFGMIRERIALWTMMKSGTPVNALGKQGVYTEEELAALDARASEIMKLAPLFKGKTLTWSGTSDLTGW